jgi:hypothetical protein
MHGSDGATGNLMTAPGQTRPFHDVDSMSGLPENGHGWAFYEYTPWAARRLLIPHPDRPGVFSRASAGRVFWHKRHHPV